MVAVAMEVWAMEVMAMVAMAMAAAVHLAVEDIIPMAATKNHFFLPALESLFLPALGQFHVL